MKVSVIGAGNVGATAANVMMLKGFAEEVVLLDIKEGFAEGKALDMMQTAKMLHLRTRVTGVTNDYAKTAGSDVIVITSGLARRPGMTREELVGKNAAIVKGVAENCLKHSPDAVFIIVSNPADTLTCLTIKTLKLPRTRVLGMSGLLDSSRFQYYLAEALHADIGDVDGMVIGVHGDLMVPLTRTATYHQTPVTELLDEPTLARIVKDTKAGGGTLTKMLGTSAWYAPGTAIATMVEAIAMNRHAVIPCITYLDGEYAAYNVCAAVPVQLGHKGIEKIITLELTEDEQKQFLASTEKSAKVNESLHDILGANA